MNKEKQLHYTEEEYREFFEILFGEKKKLYKETDYVKTTETDKPYIFFTQEFKNLFQTRAMKRIGMILQNGACIYDYENLFHTRLEHSKSTYQNALDICVILHKLYPQALQSEQVKKDMMKFMAQAATHDIGHPFFSHTGEIIIFNKLGTHEEIGSFILSKDEEVKSCLDSLYQGLSQDIQNSEYSTYPFNRLLDGQLDIDRGDFIPRDAMYMGKIFLNDDMTLKGEYNKVARSVKPIQISNEDGDLQNIFAYGSDVFDSVFAMLKTRFMSYDNVYYYTIGKARDYIGSILNMYLNKERQEQTSLGQLCGRYSDLQIQNLTLDEIYSWNDINFLKAIIQTRKQTTNPQVRLLTGLMIPKKASIYSMASSLIIDNENTTLEENEEFLQLIRELIKSDNDEDKNIMSGEIFNQNCKIIEVGKRTKQRFESRAKNILGLPEESQLPIGVFTWGDTISLYNKKPGEEIYLYNGSKVSEFTNDPRMRNKNRVKDKCGICIIPEIMRYNGIAEEKIKRINAFANIYSLDNER